MLLDAARGFNSIHSGQPPIHQNQIKRLADLGAVDALPALRRLARFAAEAKVQTAAREAVERITRERQGQGPKRHPQSPTARSA